MRILEVCHYYPPHTGGMEYHVSGLKKLLEARGHSVDVWTTRWPGVEARTFRPWITTMANPITPGMIPAIRSCSHDVVHSHIHFSFAAWASTFSRKPLVMTSHGTVLSYQWPASMVQPVFDWTLGRLVLRRPEAVIGLSPSHAQTLLRLGARRVELIPQWIDTSNMRPDNPRALREQRAKGKPVLLFVGRPIPSKGLESLFKAIEGMDVTLWIVGGKATGFEHYYEKLCSLAPGNTVFLGRIHRDHLADVYLAADIFVLPTLGEGCPLSLLEAMSFGLCCLVTDVASCNEMVNHLETGYLARPRDPLSLRHSIEWLLAHPEQRIGMGHTAQRLLPRPDSIARRYEDLFMSLQPRPSDIR